MSTPTSSSPQQNSVIPLVIALILFIASAVIGVLYWSSARTIGELDAQATESAAIIAQMATDERELTDELSAAADEAATLQADATTSADELAALESARATLQADATTSADELAALESARATLEADATTSADELAALQSARATLEADATTSADELAALESARATLEADATTSADELAALQADYDTLGTSATAVAARATIDAELARLTAATQTPAPTSEPTTVAPPPAALADVLAAANIDLDTLKITATLDAYPFDLSGSENAILSETLEGMYSDFVARATFTWNAGGANDDYCGYIFRRESSNTYYTAEIDRSGAARFYRRNLGDWEAGESVRVDAVNTAPETANTLTLIAQGDHFQLFVGDVLAVEMRDQRYTEGTLAVMAGTFSGEEGAGCAVSEAQVWSLETVIPTSSSAYYGTIPVSRTSDGAYLMGYPTAPITVVLFADFACPHCQVYNRDVIAPFVEEYVAAGDARLEFRMFPTVDRDGLLFRLAECAADGDAAAFWQAHDRIYTLAEDANTFRDIFDGYVSETNSDPDTLNACIATAQQVEIDQRVGVNAGVMGTPAIRLRLPNGALVPIAGYDSGAVPLDVLAESVR